MISNTLKINAIILFVVVLAASGGALIKQKTKIVDNYTNLKSNPLLSDINMYPQLKFHPHSKHYIYNFDTVEDTDKREFKDLASKLSQLPSNFPSKIILTTVPTSSVASSTALNTGNSLTNRELYLISKYWLQLLPDIKPELLKCLAGPTAKSTTAAGKDQFPLNCPPSLTFPHTQSTSESFSLPASLYNPLKKCETSTCQKDQSKDCYCESASPCTKPCYPQKSLSVGPRFFTPVYSSKFFYPNPTSQSPLPPTFNSTGPSKPTNPKLLPHFSFPLPHSSHTNPSIKNSGTESLTTPIHWPQKIEIKTNFALELNNQSHKTSYNSLDTLVSKLLSSPTSFETSSSSEKLKPNSPTQLFFPRYIATLYALLWSYSPLYSHPRFHPLLSQPLRKYPGLIYHPHSEHYIYTHDTIQNEDKAAFEALVSKFKQTPDLSPITLQTIPAKTTSPTPTPTTSTPASHADLYLISKYWLQLLPDIKPGLLKCLAGPTAKPTTAGGDQFPVNCPPTLTFPHSQSSSNQNQSSTESFSLPASLYIPLEKCPNQTCQKNCYCESQASCTKPCYPQKIPKHRPPLLHSRLHPLQFPLPPIPTKITPHFQRNKPKLKPQ